jgi:hypothetical protein
MTAGLDRRCTIWRILEAPDDLVGGAMTTGSAVYTNVAIRIDEKPVEQILLQQGLEITKTFDAIVIPATMVIKERDEVEITYPVDDAMYGERFRIINVSRSPWVTRHPSSYITFMLVRSERAHTIQ